MPHEMPLDMPHEMPLDMPHEMPLDMPHDMPHFMICDENLVITLKWNHLEKNGSEIP
jgi:hypothetical protein